MDFFGPCCQHLWQISRSGERKQKNMRDVLWHFNILILFHIIHFLKDKYITTIVEDLPKGVPILLIHKPCSIGHTCCCLHLLCWHLWCVPVCSHFTIKISKIHQSGIILILKSWHQSCSNFIILRISYQVLKKIYYVFKYTGTVSIKIYIQYYHG